METGWQFVLVVGLILLVIVISWVYVYWMKRRYGYQALDIPPNAIYLAGRIVDDRDPNNPALLVVYREENYLEAWELERNLARLASSKYPSYVLHPLHVTTEPGYNAFRIVEKQKHWLQQAPKTWTSSIFHLMAAPIEIVLRWHYFPIWTMIDFVSHTRHVAAGILIPEASGLSSSDVDKKVKDGELRLIETSDNAYVLYGRTNGSVTSGPGEMADGEGTTDGEGTVSGYTNELNVQPGCGPCGIAANTVPAEENGKVFQGEWGGAMESALSKYKFPYDPTEIGPLFAPGTDIWEEYMAAHPYECASCLDEPTVRWRGIDQRFCSYSGDGVSMGTLGMDKYLMNSPLYSERPYREKGERKCHYIPQPIPLGSLPTEYHMSPTTWAQRRVDRRYTDLTRFEHRQFNEEGSFGSSLDEAVHDNTCYH